MGSPLFFVSAVIPVYNGEAFLSEAVESIRQRGYRPLEIIILEDGSTDNTKRIARGLNGDVHYIYRPNSGLPAARNRGLQISQGNVIGFLDVDDLWRRDKLECQLAHLNEASSADIVIGYTRILMLMDIVEGKHIFKKWADPIFALSVGSALFRRSVFETVGCFDEARRYCDDWDWFMRARECGVTMLVHTEVTQFYRRHVRNMTNQEKLGNHYFTKMLKKSVDRRREKTCSPAESLLRLSRVAEEFAGKRSDTSERQTKD